MSAPLKECLDRIKSGDHGEQDIQALLSAVQQRDVVLATGERAVSFGGNASDTIILTGDNNIVCVLNGEKAEEVQRVVQGRQITEYVSDTVYSTFFPVLQMPQHIYAAPCKYTEREMDVAKQALVYPNDGSGYIYPFLIRDGKLFCFQDLSFPHHPFRELLYSEKLERYDAIDWWSEPDRMNWYVSLLNRALNKLTGRKKLNWDREHNRYYFIPEAPEQIRRVKYRPLNQSATERNVVWQPIIKKTGLPRPYWLHLAVGLRFHYVAYEQWCFSIRPEFRVTKDGYEPLDSTKIGGRITRQKSRMYNYDLLKEVNFWRDFLGGSTAKITLLFSRAQKLVISTSMLQNEVNWLGIPEEHLKPFKNVDYPEDPFDEDEIEMLSEQDEDFLDTWQNSIRNSDQSSIFDKDIPF